MMSEKNAVAEAATVKANNMCEDSKYGFTCTRPKGHGGKHIACGAGRVLKNWYQGKKDGQ